MVPSLALVLPIAVFAAGRAGRARAAHPWPRIHPDFTTHVVQTESQNEGYFYSDSQGRTCCHTETESMAFGCKLLQSYRSGDYFEQGSRNRTRQGNVVLWYTDVMKEMAVEPTPTGSKHKWQCAAYCPIDSLNEFKSLAAIGDCGPAPEYCNGKNAPHDAGNVTVSQARPFNNVTKLTQNWAWIKTILIVPVERNSMFLDMSDPSAPVPVLFRSQLAPGGGDTQAEQNISYVGWTPKDFDQDGTFDIDPASIRSCPKNPGGCSGDKRERHDSLEAVVNGGVAKRRRAESLPENSTRENAAAPNISFPHSWQAMAEIEDIESAGGVTAPNGDLCCEWEAASCAVAYSQRTQFHYFDYDNNRQRVDEGGNTGESRVYDFNTLKSMRVRSVAGVDTCVEYCPLPKVKHMPSFPFPSYDKILDFGPVTWKGRPAHQYRWYDYLSDSNKIPMQTYNLFLDLSDTTNPVPLEETKDITPFNTTSIMQQRTRWTKWKAGGVPASKFDIAKADTCPRASKC